MEAFSIIQIPEYQRKKLKRKKLWISIDYKRFNIKDRNILQEFVFTTIEAPNETNSNVVYDWDVALLRVHSPRGKAHQVIISVEGIWPVPIAYIEVYSAGQWLKGSVARIDFYGAFFHFHDCIPTSFHEMYSNLMKIAVDSPSNVRKTRVDIAIDFDFEFPQNGHKWIIPSENSKRNVEVHKHRWLWNSFAYLAEKNTSYWVRIYNKIVESEKNKKERWYWWKENLPDNWTRIEFEFYPPYSLMKDEELMELCLARVTGTDDIEIGLPFRPVNKFNIENAYKYFERYAKNHGIDIEQLLFELMEYHKEMEYKRFVANNS